MAAKIYTITIIDIICMQNMYEHMYFVLNFR